ncbi:MAG: hypothetical protein IMW88_09525 [Thermoflavifilum sp.]|uniref:hypothetical protein n=1 Tax=Thermoflavifilum sp. TaxID=1968839 RepID=UPI0018A5B627|nr:hypothetical protein [Thermoflavifilum sp.]QOR75573.1 MAG: hypothetical protein IMW88_09525 [Thermoflavifilum sp.]
MTAHFFRRRRLSREVSGPARDSSTRTPASVVRENGFEVVDIIGIQGLASVGFQLVQDAFLFRLPAVVKWFFVPVMQLSIALADRFHTSNHRKKDACVFMIVAQKQ